MPLPRMQYRRVVQLLTRATLLSFLCLLILITCTFGNSARDSWNQTQNNRALQERIHRVENGLLPSSSNAKLSSPLRLVDRMAFYKTPGVSVAVINNGKLEWARGYGVLEAHNSSPVTSATLFQACSISKPIAAMAALYLVDQGKLDLDEDLNERLVSWQIPQNEFTKEKRVSLRRLLSHRNDCFRFERLRL